MKKNHGTGIPGQTYLDKFLKDCRAEIDQFKKSGSCTLTWPQKILLENAVIELGGHAFDKNCPSCCLDHFTLVIGKAEHLLQTKEAAASKSSVEPKKFKKAPVRASKVVRSKYSSFLLSDGTEVLHLKNESVSAGTNLKLVVEDTLLSLPEGSHELKDGRGITVNKNGAITRVIPAQKNQDKTTTKEKKEAEEETVKLDDKLQERMDKLEEFGGVFGKKGIYHPAQPEAFLTLGQLKGMSGSELENTRKLFEELTKKMPKKKIIDLFVATKKHSKKTLEGILTDRSVEFPKNSSQEYLIKAVNQLKLPADSVVIK